MTKIISNNRETILMGVFMVIKERILYKGEIMDNPLEYDWILEIQQIFLELLAEEHSQEELMERLCQSVEKIVPNSFACIITVDPESGLMHVASAPSYPQDTLKSLEGLKPGLSSGSCGSAVFYNEPQFVINTKTDDRWADLRDITFDFNLCSSWSMPIHSHQKKPVGSFTLSLSQHRSPSSFHKRLLEVCALIVNAILKYSEYQMLLDKNQHELELLRRTIKHCTDGIIITDKDNNIVEVNNVFTKTFGFKADDVIGKNPKMLASGFHDKTFYSQMWNKLRQEKYWSGEVWDKRANGEVFPEKLTIVAVPNDVGEIENYLNFFSDLSSLRESQEQTLKLAYYDQLTGLPNRQKIIADMNDKTPSACVVFNVDDFKEINDFYGIEIGDSVLQQLGEWFSEKGCSAYRIGGDEFAMLFYENIVWHDLEQKIFTLLLLVANKIFFANQGSVNIRMTAGASIGNNKLLTRADIALNRARESKIHIALYEENENIEETYYKNMAMSDAIRKALEDERIICHYQPIINIKTGNIDKYETLVRMTDEEGNIIPPLDFLSIAKKTKLYPQITAEVIRQSCALFSTCKKEFSVNLSVSDILNQTTKQIIIDTIIETNTVSQVVFEILESEGIENYEEVTKFIEEVKVLGAKIAIDDFGTGYSNFENILKLNVDYIKIDGSLIRGINTHSRHHIIVETIVNFARKIGAKTIAEFVSDQDIYNVVKELGIDYSQGYFTGKPQAISSMQERCSQ